MKSPEREVFVDKLPSRQRSIATIVYPESAPENWLSILADSHVPAFVSPLHDLDVSEDGLPKKAHYHVMLMYEGMKSDNQLRDVVSSFGGVGLILVGTNRGYARYLCHLDDADKHQYSVEEVKCFGGADYLEMVSSTGDRYRCIREMIQYCQEAKITRFSDLLIIAADNRSDWFSVLCDSGAFVMREYLRDFH